MTTWLRGKSAPKKWAQMTNVYGVFGLTGKAIGIIAVIAIITLAVAFLLYYIDKLVAGIIFHLISFTLLMVGLITWWTSVDWGADNGGVGGGVTFGSLAMLALWLLVAGTLFIDKLTDYRLSRL